MIPLLVPNLPKTDALIPYLRGIEERRWASNFGKLVMTLEDRLSEKYDGAYVVTTSNCTSALEIMLRHQKIEGFTHVGFPALTFPATALAAHNVGLEVVLDDVGPDTWTGSYVSLWGVPVEGPGYIDAAGAFGEQKVPRYTYEDSDGNPCTYDVSVEQSSHGERVPLRSGESPESTELSDVSRGVDAQTPPQSPADRRAAVQGQRSKLRAGVSAPGKNNPGPMHGLRESAVGDASRGLQQADRGNVAMPRVPPRKTLNQMTACFSLHATKMVGCGEGGYIVTHNADVAKEYRRMTNFGFANGVSVGHGTNAKMSEYHAAVALASLDAYRREDWLQLHDWYAKHLPACVTQQKRPRGAYPILSVKLPVDSQEVLERLRFMGVECRRWYCPPLYEHPLFRLESRVLPVTAALADRLLGLPWHLYLSERDVIEVCEKLDCAVSHCQAKTLVA